MKTCGPNQFIQQTIIASVAKIAVCLSGANKLCNDFDFTENVKLPLIPCDLSVIENGVYEFGHNISLF